MINKLKDIILDDFPFKEERILQTISKDNNAIPILLKMLDDERQRNKTILSEMNLELSRAHSYITTVKDRKKTGYCKNFICKGIVDFYSKNKDYIKHTFDNTIWAKKHLGKL